MLHAGFKILPHILYVVLTSGLLSMQLQKLKTLLLCTCVVELSLQKALYAAHRHENTMRHVSGSGVSMLEERLNET